MKNGNALRHRRGRVELARPVQRHQAEQVEADQEQLRPHAGLERVRCQSGRGHRGGRRLRIVVVVVVVFVVVVVDVIFEPRFVEAPHQPRQVHVHAVQVGIPFCGGCGCC